MTDLISACEKLGLPIREDKTLSKKQSKGLPRISNQNIFWMTIQYIKMNAKRFLETFIFHYGAPDNIVSVVDINRKFKQFILKVKEPRRIFYEKVWNLKQNRYVMEKRTTNEFTQTYLCGKDETHLFIAGISEQNGAVSKVIQAHRSLKPFNVKDYIRKGYRVKRQGEYFFIQVDDKMEDYIENCIKNKIVKLQRKVNCMGDFRERHLAEYLVCIKDNYYVYGKIWDLQHKTLKLNNWYKVERNLEITSDRIRWID
ncbi:MAG: hypothetical protein ACTSRZ_11410 [Promethearchaeota archaeon]